MPYVKTKVPTVHEWFICYVGGVRMILVYNTHNKFWCDFAGKTYKPEQVDRWLNDTGSPTVKLK